MDITNIGETHYGGQKTAILVTYITKKGTRKNKVYHYQWGNGRIQPMAIMAGFFNFFLKTEYNSERKDVTLSNIGGAYDETQYMREAIPDFDKLNFAKIKDVQKIYPQLDNDNGGMVFIVDNKKDQIKIGFLLGREEVGEDAFKKFVSMYDWQEKVGGIYTDAWFMIMLHGFIQHFKIDILK